MFCTKICIHEHWDLLHHRNVVKPIYYIHEILFFKFQFILSLTEHNYTYFQDVCDVYLLKKDLKKATYAAVCRYSLRQAGSTFHMARATSAKFGLHEGNMIFNIQNNE